MRSKTVFWHGTGPHVWCKDDTLYIEDLNPHVNLEWRMTRKELFRLGWGLIRHALSPW